MPDAYDRDREKFDSNRRGRIFENGTDRFFRDREKGYTRQSEKYETPVGNTTFDKIKKDDRGKVLHTIEEKSGRLEGKKDEAQLKVVRHLLKQGEIERHTLRTVEGEPISDAAKKLIAEMSRDLGDKFTHQLISRSDAREIWAQGLQREPNQQLELPGVGEKARQQKALQREEKQRQEQARVQQAQREAADRLARQQQQEAAQRLADASKRAQEQIAQGKVPVVTREEILGVLAVSRPTPGVQSPHLTAPEVTRAQRGDHARGRNLERHRER